jgi:hypothetical protein
LVQPVRPEAHADSDVAPSPTPRTGRGFEDGCMIVVERPSLLSRLRFALPVLGLRRPVAKVYGHRVAMALGEGKTEVLTRADRSMTIRCVQGELWLTHDGDTKDVFLKEGDTHSVDNVRRLMLYALEPSGFELSFG